MKSREAKEKKNLLWDEENKKIEDEEKKMIEDWRWRLRIADEEEKEIWINTKLKNFWRKNNKIVNFCRL